MANTSTVLYDRFYDRIAKALDQTKNKVALRQIFAEIISRNNDALSSDIPDKTVFIDKKLENKMYITVDIRPEEIAKAVKDSTHIQDHWQTSSNEIYILLILISIYFNNKKQTELTKQTMFICSLYMYKNARYPYFKHGVSESTRNIMKYTVSRLTKKNDIKKYGSIMNTIVKKTEVFLQLWTEDHKKDLTGVVTDEIICNMINDNHSRYRRVLNNFYHELKIDMDSGNYMNVDQDIDDGETFIQSDNVSYMVERITQQVMNKFNLSAVPNYKIVDQVIEMHNGSCSKNNLRNMVNYLYDHHDKEMEKLVRVILQIYLFENKKKIEDIRSWDFIKIMLEQYKKLTTTNKNIVEMKALINYIFDNTEFGKKPTRQATINDCKRALFLFVLMFIMQSLIN